MKRAVFIVALIGVAGVVSGFSLLGLGIQTPRLRWDSFSLSATPPVRGANFSGTFTGSVSPAGGVSFGPASWRMGGVECASNGAGTTDGGTNNVTVRVVHEDGGEDCTCSLGSTSCTSSANLSCDCANGIVELQGSSWNMQIAGDAGCPALPGVWHCAVDLFR